MCAWSSVLSTSIHVLAEGIKFQHVSKVQPKLWKPKTENNFSAWHHLICRLCAPPETAVWKWETSGCNCSKLRIPHVGWCGSCSASAVALTKREAEVGCCIWDITHLAACAAPWLLWYPGTQQLRVAGAGQGYSTRVAQRGKTEEKPCCFTGDLSYPHNQLQM